VSEYAVSAVSAENNRRLPSVSTPTDRGDTRQARAHTRAAVSVTCTVLLPAASAGRSNVAGPPPPPTSARSRCCHSPDTASFLPPAGRALSLRILMARLMLKSVSPCPHRVSSSLLS
jgi:hypothetical protein